MIKKHKIIFAIAFSIILIISIILLLRFTFIISENKIHKEINSFVEENIEELEKITKSKDINAIKKSPILSKYEIKKVIDSDKVLDFYYAGKGFVSSSIYYGFFYIPNNDISKCFKQTFTKEGNKFFYREGNSDNTIYLEKIEDNFYYYKLSF